VPLRGWYPFEVLRFPGAAALPEHDDALVEDRRLHDALALLGRVEGSSPRTHPLPSELAASLELPFPSIVDDAAYAVDVAQVGEVDLVAVRERLDRLEDEIVRLERGFWPRVGRRIDRLRGRTGS
jgi:hypothetical protein